MRIHRPHIHYEVVALSLGDAERQLAEFMHDQRTRLLSAKFQSHPHGGLGYLGELQAFVLDLPDPEGANWVESDLWHPTTMLELDVITSGTEAIRSVAEAFVDNREFWINTVTLTEFNTNGEVYRGVLRIRLGAVIEEEVTAMRGPRGGFGV